jgi:hypothetical protein
MRSASDDRGHSPPSKASRAASAVACRSAGDPAGTARIDPPEDGERTEMTAEVRGCAQPPPTKNRPPLSRRPPVVLGLGQILPYHAVAVAYRK